MDAESSGDVMVTEGSNSSLRCTAAGHPTPLITWRREDGRPIYNHGQLHIFDSVVVDLLTGGFFFYVVVAALTVEGAVLHLSKIPRQSMGAYLCIASNGGRFFEMKIQMKMIEMKLNVNYFVVQCRLR